MPQIISGTIIDVQPLEQGTSKAGKTYQKQTFAITTGGAYPDTIAFELFAQRVDDYQHLLTKGHIVTVEYYPQSRPWSSPKTGRTQYFTSLSVARMYPAPAMQQQSAAPSAYQQPALPTAPTAPAAPQSAAVQGDQLPF